MSTVCTRKLATAASRAAKLADILIVGGGPAGLTLAAAVKSSPTLKHLKTTLVDAGDLKHKVGSFYTNPPDDYTNRVISLTPPSKKFIEEKTGTKLMDDRLIAYDGIYVTDGCSEGTLDIERDSMAYMVEILNIQSSLLNRLTTMKPESFEILDKTKVSQIEYSDPNDTKSWPVVTLDNGDVYKTRLLVGADGFNSPVRAFSGIQSRGWFYNKFGVVATMKLEYPPFKIRGWQRFLPTGPIAHLPLPNDNATLVWSTTEALSKLLLQISPEQFTTLVNAAFVLDNADMQFYYKQLEQGKLSNEQLEEDVKARMEQVYSNLENESLIDEVYPPTVKSVISSSRARFPLKLSHADTYCTDRIALLGDAAHTTHPLAGQGLNMGQGDTEALVKAMETAVKRGLDIGSLLALEPFWAERYLTNCKLLGMADYCNKLYSTDFAPVVALRTFGANVINNISPLRDAIGRMLSRSGL